MSPQDELDKSHDPSVNSSQASNKPLLVIIAMVSFLALSVLMLFSGNQTVLALDDDRLLVMENSRIQVLPLSIQQDYRKPRTVYGQIESFQQSELGFELSGTLNQLAVLEGAYVNKGDLLAQLDLARLLARKNELRSTLKNAEANANLAKLSQLRVNELVLKKLAPQQNLDEAKAQLDASQALVSEVKARLTSLEVEIEKSSLRAPFDGQIVRQYIDSGTVVSAGQAVFSIIAKTSLEARFGLPEQTAFAITPDTQFMLSIQGTSFPARVKSVSTQRNISTRTIDAVFSINVNDLNEQQKYGLVAGDLVSLSVDITQNKVGAWVPIGALAAGIRGMWTLYVVSSNNEIETRFVSIEFADEHQAYVTGAINSGDRVVVNGNHRLTPKQKVNNIEELSANAIEHLAE